MYRVCALARRRHYVCCTCVSSLDAGECAQVACALRFTLKMISKVNDVPRFEQTSPWKRWPVSLLVMIDLLRSSFADREEDESINEIDKEWSSDLRGYLYKALIFSYTRYVCLTQIIAIQLRNYYGGISCNELLLLENFSLHFACINYIYL